SYHGDAPRSLRLEPRVEQPTNADLEPTAEDPDHAVELVAGDPGEQGLADVLEQRDPSLLEPHEHGAAMDRVELGEDLGRQLVEVALAQEVALADAEPGEAGLERGVQLGAEALAQELELEVVVVVELVEERVARAAGLGPA